MIEGVSERRVPASCRAVCGRRSRNYATSFLVNVPCSLFDHSGNLFRPGGVDRVAGTRHFDLVAVGSRGVPAFEVGGDGSVRPRYHHPAWFASPRSRRDDRLEIVSKVEHLRSRHELGLLGRQVGGEVIMKLRGVEVSETVRCLLYGTRLAEVAWEALAVVRLVLSRVGHVRRDVYKTGDG